MTSLPRGKRRGGIKAFLLPHHPEDMCSNYFFPAGPGRSQVAARRHKPESGRPLFLGIEPHGHRGFGYGQRASRFIAPYWFAALRESENYGPVAQEHFDSLRLADRYISHPHREARAAAPV